MYLFELGYLGKTCTNSIARLNQGGIIMKRWFIVFGGDKYLDFVNSFLVSVTVAVYLVKSERSSPEPSCTAR